MFHKRNPNKPKPCLKKKKKKLLQGKLSLWSGTVLRTGLGKLEPFERNALWHNDMQLHIYDVMM